MSLSGQLSKNEVTFYESENISNDSQVRDNISEETIGISMGAAWIFRKPFIDLFNGKLINMHGTRLPQDRGGGGYSWQILRQNRLGYSLMHQVDIGIDTGNIIKYKEFIYPASCRIPADYAAYHYDQNLMFFDEFLTNIKNKKGFWLISQPEYLSSYWPRLSTINHAFIDWSWSVKHIESFINAFDEPYPGASAFVSDKRIFLKDCHADNRDGVFHPFQTGLVYRINNDALFIAAIDGSLIIKKVFNENQENIVTDIQVGERLYTPTDCLENAKSFKATYTHKGLKNNRSS